MTQATSSTPFPIPVRRDIHFDFDAAPARHFADDPFTSHFWNALSILAPHTETMLIRVMKPASQKVRDTTLRANLQAFLAQEGLHTRHHKAWNAALAAQGYDLAAANSLTDAAFRRLLAGKSPRAGLAICVAGEHVIYAVARAALEDPAVLGPMQPEVRRLFEWHAVEEMEHQAVAADVYRHLFGTGLRQRLIHARALFQAAHALTATLRRVEQILLSAETNLDPAQRRRHRRYLLGRGGMARAVLPEVIRFLLPGFRTWAAAGDLATIERGTARVYQRAR